MGVQFFSQGLKFSKCPNFFFVWSLESLDWFLRDSGFISSSSNSFGSIKINLDFFFLEAFFLLFFCFSIIRHGRALWSLKQWTGKQLCNYNMTPLQYSCLENPMDGRAWKAAVHGVAESWTRLSDFTFTFHFHALEKEMATHATVLAWRIPGTVEPGGLPSMGSRRVGHDWSNLAAAAV